MLNIGDRVRNMFGVVEVVSYNNTFKRYKLKCIGETRPEWKTYWEEKWIVESWTRL